MGPETTGSRHSGYSSAAPQRVPSALRESAALALMRAGPATDRRAGRRFLEVARTHGVDLSNFWAVLAPETGGARHACLMTPGSGRTAMVFLSPTADEVDIAPLAALARSACAAADRPCLAQGLLEVGDDLGARALVEAGFLRLGVLLYMRRRWTAPPPDAPAALGSGLPLPEGVRVRAWRRGDDDALCEALEASYEETLDCPELHGLRDTRDVIESHRSIGRFDPSLWWLVYSGDRPRGAVLLSASPEQGSTELVYMGIGKELRGKGLSRVLLSGALRALERRAHRDVTCAVDERNAPALALYRRCGFEEASRRVALVRRLAAGA